MTSPSIPSIRLVANNPSSDSRDFYGGIVRINDCNFKVYSQAGLANGFTTRRSEKSRPGYQDAQFLILALAPHLHRVLYLNKIAALQRQAGYRVWHVSPAYLVKVYFELTASAPKFLAAWLDPDVADLVQAAFIQVGENTL